MAVRVITDSAAGLPRELAEQLSITVIDLHLMERHGKDGLEQSTSGLSALELAAAYGREMERSQDDGVVAIHLSKELSSTYSAAVTASGPAAQRAKSSVCKATSAGETFTIGCSPGTR